MTQKTKVRRWVKRHRRRNKDGTYSIVKKHRKLVSVRPNTPKISSKQRKIFNLLSNPRLYNNEFGGFIDFKKNGNLEKFDVKVGRKFDIELDPDYEVIFHTHPDKNMSLPTPDDLISLIDNKQQQIEIVFRDGEAFIITPTRKSKGLRRLKRREQSKLFTEMWEEADVRQDDKWYANELKKLGFKVQIDKNKNKQLEFKTVVAKE